MKTKPDTIDQYIEGFSPEIRSLLILIRKIINKTAPEAEEKIRYGMPAFKLNKEHIYFSAYKKHIGMYPMYGLDELEEELKYYRAKDTKDAIHFPYNKPIPEELIKKIIELKIKKGI
jgi:uncharacterized protein YdhG (YjbR/CyaY superfamily)